MGTRIIPISGKEKMHMEYREKINVIIKQTGLLFFYRTKLPTNFILVFVIRSYQPNLSRKTGSFKPIHLNDNFFSFKMKITYLHIIVSRT